MQNSVSISGDKGGGHKNYNYNYCSVLLLLLLLLLLIFYTSSNILSKAIRGIECSNSLKEERK